MPRSPPFLADEQSDSVFAISANLASCSLPERPLSVAMWPSMMARASSLLRVMFACAPQPVTRAFCPHRPAVPVLTCRMRDATSRREGGQDKKALLLKRRKRELTCLQLEGRLLPACLARMWLALTCPAGAGALAPLPFPFPLPAPAPAPGRYCAAPGSARICWSVNPGGASQRDSLLSGL